MIVFEVYNNMNEIEDACRGVTFNFENIDHQNCKNLIEICLKNNKILQIYEEEEE